MGIIELLFLALGLSADAFAASVCKGLASGKNVDGNAIKAGLWFGGFQALMPILGYLLGESFSKFVTGFDHWIIFGLLLIIGGNMIREAVFEKDETCPATSDMSFKSMFPLAVATSLDALAAGITFSFLDVPFVIYSLIIGCVTFMLSAVGVKAGSILGGKFEKGAKIAGGLALVGLGIKVLLEHTGII
ncbi:MAG: manganese efflux pump MntP family protein [Eubacteriales bacterium]|jgi:putative Mn2+ efflux pump MntP